MFLLTARGRPELKFTDIKAYQDLFVLFKCVMSFIIVYLKI